MTPDSASKPTILCRDWTNVEGYLESVAKGGCEDSKPAAHWVAAKFPPQENVVVMISQAIGAKPISPVTRTEGAQVSPETARTGAPDHLRNGLMPAPPAPARHSVADAACPGRAAHERSMDQAALLSLPPEMRQQVLGAARFSAGEFAAIAATCSVLSCDVAIAFAGIPAEERLAMWFQACSSPIATGVQFLLDHGFDPAVRDAEGRSSLQISLQHNAEETAAMLLKAGADAFGATTADGGPGASRELLYQTGWGNVDAVSKLLQLGANANTVGRHNESALWRAVEEGSLMIVGELLRSGADPNVASDWNGATPLLNAVKLRDAPIIDLLLQHPGIHLSTQSHDGETPLGRARSNSCYDQTGRILELFERCMSARSHPASKAWFKAAVSGDVTLLQRLVDEHGAGCINSIAADGHSALYYAAANGHAAAVWQLLACGADLDLHDGDGLTALHAAVVHGHLEAVQVLLGHGADPNIAASGGRTPLHEASCQGREDIVQALLDGGAKTA